MRLVQLVRDGAAGCYPRYTPLIRRCPDAMQAERLPAVAADSYVLARTQDARMVPEMLRNVMHHRGVERND